MTSAQKKKILLAETPKGLAGLRLALDESYEVVPSTTLKHASRQINNDLHMVLCDLHFDDSRMFDLLRLVKENSATQSVHFICLQALDSVLSIKCIKMTERAVTLMGGDGFIELSKWRKALGDEAAFTKFRQHLKSLP